MSNPTTKDGTDTLYFNAAGVSFRQDAARTACQGDACRLVPEPDNQADPNAIRIELEKNGMMLGYVPREQNVVFLEAIAAGFQLRVSVDTAKPTTDGKTIWVQLKVESTPPTIQEEIDG